MGSLSKILIWFFKLIQSFCRVVRAQTHRQSTVCFVGCSRERLSTCGLARAWTSPLSGSTLCSTSATDGKPSSGGSQGTRRKTPKHPRKEEREGHKTETAIHLSDRHFGAHASRPKFTAVLPLGSASHGINDESTEAGVVEN